MRISDWSSDVCSSDLFRGFAQQAGGLLQFGLVRLVVGHGDQLALRVATQQGVQPGPVLERGLLELLLRHVGRVELRAGRARADAVDEGLVVVPPIGRASWRVRGWWCVWMLVGDGS